MDSAVSAVHFAFVLKGKFMPSKKPTITEETNPWTEEETAAMSVIAAPPFSAPAAPSSISNAEYDLDGLMTDFPTAKELERFVFDETGVVLNLKGRANKLKYQIAMDTLNGDAIDDKFIGNENPYLDKNDMVPVDDIRAMPLRDAILPDKSQVQNTFFSPFVPHPDPDFRARGKKCQCIFRKYTTGEISYEIVGPIDQKPVGEKIDKYGRTRPEIIKWTDPRTGEQAIQRADGTLTLIGQRLRSMMKSLKVNKTNQWDVWVDREFGTLNQDAISNPWAE